MNGTVRENDTGLWFEAGWDTLFYGVPFRGNIGGRYVETDTEAVGIGFNTTTKTFVPTEVKNTYHAFLPSLNAIVQPADDFRCILIGHLESGDKRLLRLGGQG